MTSRGFGSGGRSLFPNPDKVGVNALYGDASPAPLTPTPPDTPEPPTDVVTNNQNRMAVAEKVHTLYSRENTLGKIYGTPQTNGFHPEQSGYVQFDNKPKDPKRYEKTIDYFECLTHLMTACGLLLVMFAILVPICNLVWTIIVGFAGLHVPGYLAMLVFIGIIICVFLARSDIKSLNRFILFICLAVLSAVAVFISIGMIIVGIIGLNQDSPKPYGVGSGLHPKLMEILAMECVIVSSGVITLITTMILTAIGAYFARGVWLCYHDTADTDTPSSDRAQTPAQGGAPAPPRSPNYALQRAQTAPRTASGQRPVTMVAAASEEPPRTPSQASNASVGQIAMEPMDLDHPVTPGTYNSTRRWGKTKNVLRAIMDIKQ